MKNYVCCCGKTFDNPQAFNGHKCHCKEHLISMGKYENYLELQKNRIKKLSLTNQTKAKKHFDEKQNKWIAEQHTCEKCGKVMTVKFGSGRFCSKICANSHSKSAQDREKISLALKTSPKAKERIAERKKIHLDKISEYMKNPKRCLVCGNIINYEYRNNLTCCKKCHNEIIRREKLKLCSDLGTNLCGKGKRGYYKGYYCQSSWELAYVIYCLDHSIKIERNTDSFKYRFDGYERTYYPDFKLSDGTYIEIKGYYDRKTSEKEKQFPKNKKLIIYKRDSMRPILKYVQDNYGKNFTDLYEIKY